MSEETEQIVEQEEIEFIEPKSSWKGRAIVAAAAAFVVIVIAIFGIWYLMASGKSGKPVAAPRDITFGKGGESTASAFSSDQKITLTDEQLKSAKFEFTTVGETMDGESIASATTGVVRANEYESTPINSYVGGIVKDVFVELGEPVRRGQVIATVSSDDLAMTQSRYLSMKAELEEAEKRYKRALALSDISEESRNEIDKTSAVLKAAQALLAEKKSNFERSQKLVAIGSISKREFERSTTEYETAKANVEEAEQRFDRAKRLLQVNPMRNNELDQTLTKVRNMQADTAALRERLYVLGLSRNKIDGLKSASQVTSLLSVESPIAGTLTERKINRGEVVSANSQIATVTDLSTVWVIGQVYEKDLGKVKVGSGASVRTDSYPGELFRGSVTYVDPSLDNQTRTAQVRVVLPNPGERLKLGMYVNVAFATLQGSEKTAPIVPKEAVQQIGRDSVVFLVTEDPKIFTMRRVRIGEERDGSVPVLEGLFVGEKVVTGGSFLLRAEWLKTNPEGS